MQSTDNAAAVNNLQLFNEKLRFLHELSRSISEKKPLDRLLADIMESSKQLVEAEASSLLIYDENDGLLHFHVATGEKGESVKPYSIRPGQGIAGWVAENRQPLMIEDCYQDARFNREFDRQSGFRTVSMICVPMIKKDNLLGIIQVINKKGGGAFSNEDLYLFETLAAQCAVAVENHHLTIKQIRTEALERELATAREIQQNLLPHVPPVYQDLDIARLFIQAREVGGDYYNFFKIDNEHSLFFITDVSGKSISAALIVSIIDACLHSYIKIKQNDFDLRGLIRTTNQILIECTTATTFAASWFGLLHHPSGRLISVNAGHNPPYIFKGSGGGPLSLNAGGLFLGAMDLPYESEEIVLEPDDMLVYYTDGITEAWNNAEEEYSDERLIRVLSELRIEPAEKIMEKLEKDIQSHVGRADQSDDMACVIVKRKQEGKSC